MKQLMQKLGDGTMEVLDATIPVLGDGMLLVKNHFSLISAGTEGGTVTAARKSLLGKAKERPEQVKQVIDTVRQQGVLQTYRAVSKKLDSYSPLGYSSAGVVLEVGAGVRGFSVGDHVACAGAGYANHAEVVSVPENLCVKLAKTADLCAAAYNTLGAIALQGARQADTRIGETCIVIGLGLIGQLTCLILRAAGVKVIGLDIDRRAVRLAKEHCADAAYDSSDPLVADSVLQATGGIGADAVIITAATSSLEPVNLAGRLLRQRGTVIIVGDVPTGFNREPDYYRKELKLKMSCSYGPGRYNLNYEEKGYDYPAGYVRWTENRNLQAFQELVHSGSLELAYMTTHRFSIDKAPQAYDLILDKKEEFLGIIIEYDAAKSHARQPVEISLPNSKRADNAHGVGFIGAGSYAMSHLLPNLPSDGSINLTGVMTSTGTSSRSVAEKFNFKHAAASVEDVIDNPETGTVFIATRHDSHAKYVIAALNAGKNVFVEKPLCIRREDILDVKEAWKKYQPVLMVGFNRRFAPLAQQMKGKLGGGPISMIYRVNAGAIPRDSWIQDRDFGGGRIIGELCHFVDFASFVTGAKPFRVHAQAMDDSSELQDTVSTNISFENGSIASISYFANGPKSLPKEYVEVYKGGIAACILDFKTMEIYDGRKKKLTKLISQDKGQRAMVHAFVSAATNGGESPISLQESISSTEVTFAIEDSLRTGQAIDLNSISML